MIPRSIPVALAFVMFAAIPAPAGAQETHDHGRFIVYEKGVPVAHEEFSYTVYQDSIVVRSETRRRLRARDGHVESYSKNMGLIADGFDFGLKRYVSNQRVFGRTDVNGFIAPADAETAFTAYQERDGQGEASTLVQPPGRMVIVDSQLYTLFDVIARMLARQTFEQRPLNVLAFGERPEVLETIARAMPPDTLRWLGKRLYARRIELADEGARFQISLAPEGHMLRLVQPEAGIEVVREEPEQQRPKRRGR